MRVDSPHGCTRPLSFGVPRRIQHEPQPPCIRGAAPAPYAPRGAAPCEILLHGVRGQRARGPSTRPRYGRATVWCSGGRVRSGRIRARQAPRPLLPRCLSLPSLLPSPLYLLTISYPPQGHTNLTLLDPLFASMLAPPAQRPTAAACLAQFHTLTRRGGGLSRWQRIARLGYRWGLKGVGWKMRAEGLARWLGLVVEGATGGWRGGVGLKF